jgi:hypothetical protein
MMMMMMIIIIIINLALQPLVELCTPFQVFNPMGSRIIKSRKMRWAGHLARIGEKINAYRLLVGRPEGGKPTSKTKT